MGYTGKLPQSKVFFPKFPMEVDFCWTNLSFINFVKEITGQMGIVAKRLSYTDEAYNDIDNKIYSEDNLLQFLSNYSIKNSSLMIQPVIRSHKTWRPFTSGALATRKPVTKLLTICLFRNRSIRYFSKAGSVIKLAILQIILF